MNKATFYAARDKSIYDDFMSGKMYAYLSYTYDLTESGIKQVLRRYRAAHNLPNGRKNRKG